MTEDAEADLIIGADGAYSKVRKIMTRQPFFNCAQMYIEHGYVELSVPCREDNEVSKKKYHRVILIKLFQTLCYMDLSKFLDHFKVRDER